MQPVGKTEAQGSGNLDLIGDVEDTTDFLSRERALLGDDADQFASPNDKLATVEDDNDDLLGGDTSYQANVGTEEMAGFESSFPVIDTTNEVCPQLPSPFPAVAFSNRKCFHLIA